MSNKINFLPPWAETNLQPAFYDVESGTCLQQTARMYDKVNQLVRNVNEQNETIADYIQQFIDLKDYVDNYFDNLDVQTEINNKLDEMLENGELGALLSSLIADTKASLENELSSFENLTTGRIDSIDNKVDAVASGSPIAVSSTDDMTDTTKVYVNTSDGKWYYYDGDSWEIGGTYQSTGIADGAITVFNLDDSLQNDFIREYENVAIDCDLQGYAKGTTTVTIDTSSDYVHDVIDLENNTYYEFSGINYYSVVGLIVADSSDNVVYTTRSQSSSSDANTGVYLRFKTNQAGLKAYINKSVGNAWTPFQKQATNLTKLIDVTPNYQENSLTNITSTTSYYVKRQSVIGEFPTIQYADTDKLHIDCYKVNKGIKYHILSGNLYDYNGIAITDDKFELLYKSGSTYADNLTAVDYTFTATTDGYVFLTYHTTLQPYHSISIVNALNTKVDSPLKYKKIVYNGDSICESRTSGASANGGAYAKIISDLTNSIYDNSAHGGATLSYVSGQSGHSVANEMSSLPVDGDIYCFEGGINDWWQDRELGTFSESDYTSAVDISTITGAMETIFRYALTNYLGKPIVFVIIHKTSNPFATHAGVTFAQVRERMIAVCTKYSIPYFDAWKESGLNGMITAQKNAYLDSNAEQTPDGTHPNENGYKKFYVPSLLALFEKLIVK